MARLEQTRILAPQNGVILSRAVEPGDTVRPGATLFEMAADGEAQLVIEPDERNLAWIRPGQTARASADAYPQEIFDAEVSYIAPAIDPQRGSIEVRLRVPDPPAFLRPDMTVSVDLTVASKRQVIAIPSEAVRATGSPAPWVPVVERGRIARRTVTLGIRGAGHTEIQAGLDEGAEVVLATEVTLADRQRVRVDRGDR
jgi:HlyD family secretion protein